MYIILVCDGAALKLINKKRAQYNHIEYRLYNYTHIVRIRMYLRPTIQ